MAAAPALLGACCLALRAANSRRSLRRLKRHGARTWGVSARRGRPTGGRGQAVIAAAVAAEVDEEVEEELLDALQELRDLEFFSLFRLNLFAPCLALCEPEEVCDMRCAVEPVDDVSDWLRDKDEGDFDYKLDGWSRFDSPTEQAEYYSILQYPEGDTGYDGSKIWSFIHGDVCFPEGCEGGDAVLNAAVSAVHTCIAMSIVVDIRERGDSEGAAAQFARRVSERPGAVEDVRATRALVLSAVQRAKEVLRTHDYGDEQEDILPLLEKVTASPLAAAAAHDVPADASSHRLRLRELCLVMDCVACNACRMHGKINALGLATAFRILWSGEIAEGKEQLSRIEVASLLVLLEKLTTALHKITTF